MFEYSKSSESMNSISGNAKPVEPPGIDTGGPSNHFCRFSNHHIKPVPINLRGVFTRVNPFVRSAYVLRGNEYMIPQFVELCAVFRDSKNVCRRRNE